MGLWCVSVHVSDLVSYIPFNLSMGRAATASYSAVRHSCGVCTLVTTDYGSHCVSEVSIQLEITDCLAVSDYQPSMSSLVLA